MLSSLLVPYRAKQLDVVDFTERGPVACYTPWFNYFNACSSLPPIPPEDNPSSRSDRLLPDSISCSSNICGVRWASLETYTTRPPCHSSKGSSSYVSRNGPKKFTAMCHSSCELNLEKFNCHCIPPALFTSTAKGRWLQYYLHHVAK